MGEANTANDNAEPKRLHGRKRNPPIRWAIEHAAREFGINPATLRNRLVETPAGEDGRFSTAQICAAIYGDYEREQVQKMAAERELAQLKAAEARKSLISTEDAFLAFSGTMYQVRRSILLLSQISEALVGKTSGEIRLALDNQSETILRQIASAKPEEVLKSAA